MQKLKDLGIAILLFVIGFYLVLALISPYLGWIGLTLAIAIIGLILWGVIALIRRVRMSRYGHDELNRGR